MKHNTNTFMAFTIASTDNVDFLQSNAAVYSGDQHHSWHATTIQLVQPMPYAAIHTEQSIAARRLFSTVEETTASDNTEIPSSRQTLAKTNPAEKLRSLLARIRQECSSPVAPPLRSIRSPITKRARTFAEAMKHHSKDVSDMNVDSIIQYQ